MDSDKSDDENEKTAKQIVDYYTRFSQTKGLLKYFAGSSLEYLPQIPIPQDAEVPQIIIDDDTNTKTLIEHAQAEVDSNAELKLVSPASSVTSNRKLEWDNGADIGYNNCNPKLHKSLSLPTLTEAQNVPESSRQKGYRQIVTTVSYLSHSDENASKTVSSPAVSTTTTQKFRLLSSSSSSSCDKSNNKVAPTSSSSSYEKSKSQPLSSSSSSLNFIKGKIGSPDAESTPRIVNNKNRDTPFVRNKMKKTITLCITKPISLECIDKRKLGDNKRIQTNLPQESVSRQVQTSPQLKFDSPKDNQSVMLINESENGDSDALASKCDSFEYFADNFGAAGDNLNLVQPQSTPDENSKEIPLLAQLINEQQSTSLKEDVDKSITILQKLLKSKKYDSVTKKRYIKRIVRKIVDNKYSEDSTTSSELFVPLINKAESDIQQKLQENLPWFPPPLSKFTVKTFSDEYLPHNNQNNIFTINTPSSDYSNARSSFEKKPNTSDSYNSWKAERTTSEKLLEDKKKGAGDHLVKFAKKERQNQLSWIDSEISHLTKLRRLLDEKKLSGAHKTTTVYMLSENNPTSSGSASSGRNYVIHTDLAGSSSSERLNVNFCTHRDFQTREILCRCKDDRIVGEMEALSDDRNTNLQVKARNLDFYPKKTQLLGGGKYDTFPRSQKEVGDKCWPCGMPKANMQQQENGLVCTQQYTFDVPLADDFKSPLSLKVDEIVQKYKKSQDNPDEKKVCPKCKRCAPSCKCKNQGQTGKRIVCADCKVCKPNCKCKKTQKAITDEVSCQCRHKLVQKDNAGENKNVETDRLKYATRHSQVDVPVYRNAESQSAEDAKTLPQNARRNLNSDKYSLNSYTQSDKIVDSKNTGMDRLNYRNMQSQYECRNLEKGFKCESVDARGLCFCEDGASKPKSSGRHSPVYKSAQTDKYDVKDKEVQGHSLDEDSSSTGEDARYIILIDSDRDREGFESELANKDYRSRVESRDEFLPRGKQKSSVDDGVSKKSSRGAEKKLSDDKSARSYKKYDDFRGERIVSADEDTRKGLSNDQKLPDDLQSRSSKGQKSSKHSKHQDDPQSVGSRNDPGNVRDAIEPGISDEIFVNDYREIPDDPRVKSYMGQKRSFDDDRASKKSEDREPSTRILRDPDPESGSARSRDKEVKNGHPGDLSRNYFEEVEKKLLSLARKISECRCKVHIHPSSDQLKYIQDKVQKDIDSHRSNRRELDIIYNDVKEKTDVTSHKSSKTTPRDSKVVEDVEYNKNLPVKSVENVDLPSSGGRSKFSQERPDVEVVEDVEYNKNLPLKSVENVDLPPSGGRSSSKNQSSEPNGREKGSKFSQERPDVDSRKSSKEQNVVDYTSYENVIETGKKYCKCCNALTQTQQEATRTEKQQTDQCICSNYKIQTEFTTSNEGIQCQCECCNEYIQATDEEDKESNHKFVHKDAKMQTRQLETREELIQTQPKDVKDGKLQTEGKCSEDCKMQTDKCLCEHKLTQTSTISEDSKKQYQEESTSFDNDGDSRNLSSSSYESYSSDSDSSSSESYTSETLKSCVCCKKQNVKQKNLDSLRKQLSEQAYPLCTPCFRQNRRFDGAMAGYNKPNHVCNCYSVVQTKTLDEIKKTIREINEIDDQFCSCVNTRNHKNRSGYCKHCKCRLKKTSKSKSGIAYLLTFENESPKSGDKKKRRRKKRKSLEEIKIKIPVPPRKKHKDRDNRRKKHKSYESDVSSYDNRRKRERLGSPEGAQDRRNIEKGHTLQEYLNKNRPNFVETAESRRKTVNESRNQREKSSDNNKLEFLRKYRNNASDKNTKRLFTHKEMKDITKKHYQKLPEVQKRLVDNREREIRQANRYMADTFNKKLRDNVLKGKRSLTTDVNVINL